MYIINDTFFTSPNYLIPNIEEADSKSYEELERLIDLKCRLFLQSILTTTEIAEFEAFLVLGMFPIVTTGIPQKWIDLVNGKGNWKGLIEVNGTSKTSLLVDLVYYHWLIESNTYITSFGESKSNAKGAESVNPTQRIVKLWNDFYNVYHGKTYNAFIFGTHTFPNTNSLVNFFKDNQLNFPERDLPIFEVKNQLGL